MHVMKTSVRRSFQLILLVIIVLIAWTFGYRSSELDLTLCPLCDRPVRPSLDWDWLHPNTP